jgi:hypothetical protein
MLQPAQLALSTLKFRVGAATKGKGWGMVFVFP